jgi:hypothetical protein
MRQQIQLSQQVFHLGLILMLASGLLSAMDWVAGGNAVLALTALGGSLALGARFWRYRLRRAVRGQDMFVEPASHPLDFLRGPGCTTRPRSTL